MRRRLTVLLIGNYLLIILTVAGFIYLTKKTNEHNTNQNDLNQSILQTFNRQNNPFTRFDQDTSRQIVLTSEDMEELNSHLQFLTDKITIEVSRSQQNSQYDIDRINTFVTFGIGILAVIGGLLPLFFNSTLREQFQDSINTLENRVLAITTTTIEANRLAQLAIQTGPSINTLILQNAISRFLNIGLSRIKDPKRKEFLDNIFTGLIEGFTVFRDVNFENLTPGQQRAFNDAIDDFRLGVQNLLLSTAVEARNEYNFLNDLFEVIKTFKENIGNNFENSIERIIEDLNRIKISFL